MNFTAIRGRFVLGTAQVKALGWLEKKNQKRKMTKHDFTTSRFVTRHFVFCVVICLLQYSDVAKYFKHACIS